MLGCMATTDRPQHRGPREAARIGRRIGDELRHARLTAGLSQRELGAAAGLSQPHISRIERFERQPAWLEELATQCAALGLRVSIKLYPDGSPVRDAGQLRLLARLRAELSVAWRWRSEALIGGLGDLRAWDVRLDGPGSVGIDAETRLHDVQAVQRRVAAKARDSNVQRVVVLVARTRPNESVLREHAEALASTFPAGTREVMAALRAGRLPPRDGLVSL